MTTTYEMVAEMLQTWRNERSLETAGKFFATVFGLNQEPKLMAAAVDELALRGGSFEVTLSSCIALALWASRPTSIDGAAYIAEFLDALSNELVREQVMTLFPVSVSTSLPGFKPQGSALIRQLEAVLQDRTLEEPKRQLARDVLAFLATRRHRLM